MLLSPLGALLFIWGTAMISAKGVYIKKVKRASRFRDDLEALRASEKMTPGELREAQNEKLRQLLSHAVENVPYYWRLIRRHHLSPHEFKTVEDLKKLPHLSKLTFRERYEQFIADKTPRWSLTSGWSTGSLGTPVNALRDYRSKVFENALIWLQRGWAGIHWDDRKALVAGSVWGELIIPFTDIQQPYWRYNLVDNQILCSYYQISDKTLPDYLNRLRRFKPAYVEAFPSTLLALAECLRKRGENLDVKALFTSSEPLYAVHRKFIEASFRAPVFDLYGQSERVTAAVECERHEGLHLVPLYGVTEILKPDGTDAGPGETGEIFGTGLNNYGMPLIRYRTGDLATVAEKPCSCGRAWPLLKNVQGRTADVLKLPGGRFLPGTEIMEAFWGIENVLYSQLIQIREDELRVRIVRCWKNQRVDESRLTHQLKLCVGNDVHIHIEYVDQIKQSGDKFKWVVSELKTESEVDPRSTRSFG